MNIKCIDCGTFIDYRSIRCYSCAAKIRKPPIKKGKIVKCEVCKKEIYVIPYLLKAHKYHFCSVHCRSKLLPKLMNDQIRTGKAKYKNKTCIICKKEFILHSAVQKCCSEKCKNINTKERRKKWLKVYYSNNKEKFLRRTKKYRQIHKKEINQRLKERRKLDINYRLQNCLRCSIRRAIKNKYKSAKTMKLIGCSIEKLKQHLEKQFKPGMTWNNYGNGYNGKGMKQWHIDHIIPCAKFDLSKPSEQRKCFHYTNLQSLWAKENLSKGAKI